LPGGGGHTTDAVATGPRLYQVALIRAVEAGIEKNADVFEGVADAADEEIAAQSPGQAETATATDLVIHVVEALEIEVPIV